MLGKVIKKKGQTYTCTKEEPYVRQSDGAPSKVLTWQSTCADCGKAFEIKTGLKIPAALNRRCQKHARPGVKVSKTKKTAKRAVR